MGSVHEFPGINPADAVIGARVRMWRAKRGMDQDQLAAALHISPAQMRLIESGRIHLDSAGIHAATRVLHLPIWVLLADEAPH